MKVVYRNITEDLLCIWVYSDDGKAFVANVAVKKAPSGFYFVNVNKGVGSSMAEDPEACSVTVGHLEKPEVEEQT